MTEQFGKAGLPFEYVEAVDGRTVPLPPGWKSGAGAYGCYRSHMITLERAMSAGHKCIAVYEDDVEFVDDYANKLSTLLVQVSSLDANWQAVFPGGQHMTHPVETSEHNVIRGINVHRTHAYIVRGSYIQELYNLWNGSDKHIDHTWGEAQKGKRVYCPRKWLAAQSAGHSDINGRNLNQRFWTPRRVMPCGGCGKGNPNAFRRQQERARANLNTAPNRRPR